MRKPFVWVLFFFSLGILFASQARPMSFWILALIALCCMVCSWAIRNSTIEAIAMVFAVFFCGAACLTNHDMQPPDHLRHILSKIAGDKCVVRGFVASDPEERAGRTTFTLSVRRIIAGNYSYSCSGALLVVLDGATRIEYGRAVDVRGTMRFLSGFRGSRRLSIRDFFRQKGIYAVLRVRSPLWVVPVSEQGRTGLMALSFKIKKEFQKKIHSYLPPVAAGIMEAMLLGDKKDIPRTVYSDMIKSGTVHILVVSGFNVSIVAGLLALFLKVLRVSRIIRLVIIVPALVLYCLMTGVSPPVVRATIMGIFFFSSWYVRRDPDIFQALGMAAFVMLVGNPRELYDASFQLSFMSVFAICSLAPRIEKLAHVDKIALRPLRWLAGLAAVSLSAWIGTGGFIAYYFKIMAPVTVLANIFIPVLASFITLCGIGLVAAGYICPYLANSFASVSEFLIVVLLWINGFFINIPGAYVRLP
jgi:competence protein ComEC